MNIIERYGVFGLIRLARDYIFTKLFFPSARLVRWPIYVRGKSAIRFGGGLTTGVNVRLDAFEALADKPVLFIGRNVQIINKDRVEEADRENQGFYIRNGIVVVLKNGVIPNGTVI